MTQNSSKPAAAAAAAAGADSTQQQEEATGSGGLPLRCPRCESANTKFCYFNNYSLSQPRHFCKACKRYWTRGGALRNVPVGGGCRKNKRLRHKPPSTTTSSTAAAAAVPSHPFLLIPNSNQSTTDTAATAAAAAAINPLLLFSSSEFSFSADSAPINSLLDASADVGGGYIPSQLIHLMPPTQSDMVAAATDNSLLESMLSYPHPPPLPLLYGENGSMGLMNPTNNFFPSSGGYGYGYGSSVAPLI